MKGCDTPAHYGPAKLFPVLISPQSFSTLRDLTRSVYQRPATDAPTAKMSGLYNRPILGRSSLFAFAEQLEILLGLLSPAIR
jgi:hypothetical protein